MEDTLRPLVTALRCKNHWLKQGQVGPLIMPRSCWEAIHQDFRNDDAQHPRCLVLRPGGTCSVPVQFGSPRFDYALQHHADGWWITGLHGVSDCGPYTRRQEADDGAREMLRQNRGKIVA